MSFLRGLSSDSLSSASKSKPAQSSSNVVSSGNPSPSNLPPGPSAGAQAGIAGKRHHAKALLHPVSLLLRRRSAQSNTATFDYSSANSSHSAASKFGPSRDLPDDFDPGIIYGTRHPDWSSPVRSMIPRAGNPNFVPGAQVSDQAAKSSSGHHKTTSPENGFAQKRQPLFTEHFGDTDAWRQTLPQSPTPLIDPAGNDVQLVSSSLETSDTAPSLSLQTSPNEAQNLTPDEQSKSSELASPLDQLSNSSRFSFEASSAANSVRNEELTLSDGLLAQRFQTTGSELRLRLSQDDSDRESLRSFSNQSITSDDLRDCYEDGFVTSSIFPTESQKSIAPPPGFEGVQPYSLEEVQDLPKESSNLPEIENPDLSTKHSSLGSDFGTDGSVTDNEEETTLIEGYPFPPFMNPTGAGQRSDTPPFDPNLDTLQFGNNVYGPSHLNFQNSFQLGSKGVTEYENSSPLSIAPIFSPIANTAEEFTNSEVYDLDDPDEDDMIAEANRDALASDSEGWYGREFGFYSSSSTGQSTYLAGGFFGADLPRPGFIRNPSLTPISERSESSLRNSLNFVGPNNIAAGGISAGPLSAALLAELAKHGQISCDDTTMNQVQALNGPGVWEGCGNSAAGSFFPTSPGTLTGTYDPQVHHILDDDGLTSNLISDITTSYTHDADLGWVMEKRRGGELIRREVVRGAV